MVNAGTLTDLIKEAHHFQNNLAEFWKEGASAEILKDSPQSVAKYSPEVLLNNVRRNSVFLVQGLLKNAEVSGWPGPFAQEYAEFNNYVERNMLGGSLAGSKGGIVMPSRRATPEDYRQAKSILGLLLLYLNKKILAD